MKKPIHLFISLFHPISSKYKEFLKNNFKKFLFKTIFPNNSPIANRRLITVGFKYIKIGLLKKILRPPKIATRTAPSKGIYGIFFSRK